MIEVEVRSFINRKQYNQLLKFFKKNGKLVKEDYQETYYLGSKEDLRIQRNKFFSKIWFKKGKIHDDAREEFEISFDRRDFRLLEKLFMALGFKVQIKWFRKRFEFFWEGIKVCLDYTKGYGYIIELEKVVPASEKNKTLSLLKQRFKELNLPLTPRKEFEEKFKYYSKNWKSLIKG
jgi:predicted adenylyl cyclase CyaB